MKKLLFFFLFLPQLFAFAQSDTVSIVSYNLLNFPEGRTDCGNNTLVPNRADTLRKILNYLKPDIFVACEIQTEAGADSVLTQSLNVQGQTNYASATYNVAGLNQGLNNQLYYNTTKLTLLYQDIIQTSPRSIDHYVLYMNDPNLSSFFDTTFIEVYMCHLKAGSGSSEQNIRAQQVQELVDFIQVRPSDRHHIVCGDLNVYRSSEQAYQLLLNAGVGLIDPINRPGNWNNNASFADIHTQSTRSGENLDCGSQGGSDDRFDQILVSSNVMTGTDSLRYIDNSYLAIGNDGNHYNTSLIAAPTNSMYPDSVVKALYYMSDHLPVAMKVVANYPTSNGLALYPSYSSVTCYDGNDGSATITPNDGQAPYQYQWDVNAGSQTTQTATGLSSGSYCVTVTDALGEQDDYCLFVPQPDSIAISVFKSPDDGSCTGEAFALISGGQAPYDVVWNDPSIQTGTAAYNLCEGFYTVTVTDANNCSNTYTVEITSLSSSIEEALLDDLVLYPNPTTSFVTIDNLPNHTNISIQDLQGRNLILVEDVISKKTNVDLSQFTPGVYLVHFQLGSTRKTVRIQKAF